VKNALRPEMGSSASKERGEVIGGNLDRATESTRSKEAQTERYLEITILSGQGERGSSGRISVGWKKKERQENKNPSRKDLGVVRDQFPGRKTNRKKVKGPTFL